MLEAKLAGSAKRIKLEQSSNLMPQKVKKEKISIKITPGEIIDLT